MALITTVSTTPLTHSLYPPWYQKKLEAWKRGEIDWDGNQLLTDGDVSTENSLEKIRSTQVRKVLVYLRLDSLPSLFTFISLLGGDKGSTATKVHRNKLALASVPEGTENESSSSAAPKRPLEVHGVRVVELTERTSSVMKVSEQDEYAYRDPVVNAFRTFAQLNNVSVSGEVAIVPEDSFAETLSTQATDHASDLVLIPWSQTGHVSEIDSNKDNVSSGLQDHFIRKTLETATTNTAVFYNRGFGGPSMNEPRTLTRSGSGLSLRSHRDRTTAPIADRSHHVYFPFFGGADDRVALRFVLQLAANSNITATIIHFILPLHSTKTPEVTTTGVPSASSQGGSSGSKLDITERMDTEALHTTAAQDTTLLHTLRDSLPAGLANRVVFVEVSSTTPIADCIEHAKQEIGQTPKNAGDLIVVGRGRHVRLSDIENHGVAGSDMRRTLGVLAESIISSGVNGSVLVMKAGGQEA